MEGSTGVVPPTPVQWMVAWGFYRTLASTPESEAAAAAFLQPTDSPQLGWPFFAAIPSLNARALPGGDMPLVLVATAPVLLAAIGYSILYLLLGGGLGGAVLIYFVAKLLRR
jgi:hypothetical protein